MKYEQWIKILSAVNADGDLNQSNIIEKIKERLQRIDLSTFQDWKNDRFNINYKFTLYTGLASFKLTLLYLATRDGCKKVVEALISNGADVNTKDMNGLTPLYWAAKIGHKEVVNALIKAGAGVNINAKSKKEQTSLHRAAETGHTGAINALLAKGADIDAIDDNGETPLRLAIKNGHTKAVNALLEAEEFNINTSDGLWNYGWALLHWVIANDHKKIVEVLIASKASVNVKGENGWTPLHWAAVNGHTDTVNALLAAEADVNLQNADGKTPLHLAVEKKHKSAAEFLIAHEIKLQGSNAQKPEYLVQHNSNFTREMSEYWNRCLGEYEKLEEEDKLLHDFLKESDTSTLVSIWEKNEDICSKFDNQKSLQRQYPEYAYTLINKANEIKKEIFLHNHEPLIDALSTHYRRDFQAMIFAGIENFFKVHKDDFRKELGNGGITLINFVDFENFAERHAPTLKVRAFAKVIENNLSSESPDDQNIDQACSSSVDEQVPQPVSEITGIIKHIGASNSEASSELESNGNQQSTQPEFLTTNGNSSSMASESGSTKILVSDQENDIQNNNIQPSSRSEKRSKLPIVTASVLAVAGVALGVAIAVHLEMLAVGIVVGACCLVAAAIIYYCNQPSKSLENSNVQGFSGNHEQPTL
ncbi:ankyrin repeat domain-containing protein [Wolbachia endosymbiont (group A) of Ectemnius continuus]|uniref:ankyrin repeat domain-containing protein n=1 Tax=Wolbachia endosymbiont (group A) of Ectemnius continuus TaxID=2954002 RepID=UPI00222E810B|nr:ankyrin repeat domain-containing protein [Wolbachia endosymbiont (group A) of Ectemnius continuus]